MFWLNISSNSVIGANPLPLNTWSHVLASYDGQTMRLYVNGIQVGSKSYTQAVTVNNQAIHIGDGFGFPFRGAIDEPTFFNRALTPAEAAALVPGPATYTQTGGTLTVEQGGSLLSLNGPMPNDSLNLQGGKLTGTGTVNANVVNSATISPGESPGFLDITGDYVQSPTGVLEIEIAGRDENVPQFDRLRVTGTATLDGTVRVVRLDDFEPAPGDAFRVISAASRVGQFATQQIPAPGGAGREIATQYDSTGLTLLAQRVPPVDFEFATTQTGDSQPRIFDIVLDATGNTYVTGSIFGGGMIDFDAEGPAAAVSVPAGSGFVGKYDPAGQLLWVRLITPTAGQSATGIGIAIDPANGDVLVSGNFTDSATITDGVSTAVVTDTGSQAAFVFRLTSSGGVVWGRATSGAGAELVSDVAVGPTGTAYIVGDFTGTSDFNSGGGTANLTAVGTDAFVWALDAAGNFVAADRLGGAGTETGAGVAIRGAGAGADTVWVTGTITSSTTGLATLTPVVAGTPDIFVLKLTQSAGTFTSDPSVAAVYGGTGVDFGRSIAVGPDGSAVIAGWFEFSVDFDKALDRSFTLTSSGDADAFLLKLSAAGGFHWARGIGGYREEHFDGLALDPAGNIFVTGNYQDVVDFDPLDGSYILQTAGTRAFAARYNPDGTFGWVVDPSGSGPLDYSVTSGIAASGDGRVVIAGSADNTAGGVDFDPSSGVYSPIPTGQTRPFIWSLDQKAAPQASIVRLPTTAISEGATLALAANVTDADSSYFTYSWSLSRNGVDLASGTGPAFGYYLADQGTYEVRLTVLDESGNSDIVTAAVMVTNSAPVLNPTAFGTASPFASSAASENIPAAMATGGGFVLLGVPKRDAGATDAGAVDVYTTSGTFVRTLTAPTAVGNALFGSSVAVIGKWAVVGAPDSTTTAGSVYVFDLTNALAPAIVITGPSPVAGDKFGTAVAAIGNLLAVGAPGRAVGGVANAGAVYLFDPASGALVRSLLNPTPQPGDGFGAAIVAVGGNLLVGAPGDDSAGLDAGAAYLVDPGSGLAMASLQPSSTSSGSNFGAVLAASGLYAAIGAPLDDSAGTDAGGVFLYHLDPAAGGFGSLLRTIRSPNTSPNNGKFGTSLAFSGNRLLVGAEGDGTTLANSGSAFLFDADPASKTFGTSIKTFKKATPAAADRFGAVVSFLGDDVLIGAPQDDSATVEGGRVYRFSATAVLSASAATIPENGVVTVSGSFADSGADDAHRVTITWRDGTKSTLDLAAGVSTFSATHQYLDDNPTATASDNYVIGIRVADLTPNLIRVENDRIVHYDGATGALLGDLTAASSLGPSPAPVAVGPDGNVYVIDGNRIESYHGITGAALAAFATLAREDLAFGPDGHLYAFSSTGDSVNRFDIVTGISTVFIPSGSVLSAGLALAFGPDGNLYIGTGGSGKILRFSGTNGAYMGEFADLAPYDSIIDLEFGADGGLYALAGQGAARDLLRIDGTTGGSLGVFIDATSTTSDALFGHGGDVLISQNGSVVRHDGTTGDEKGTFLTSAFSGKMALLHPQDEASLNLTVANVAPTVIVHAAPSATAGQYTLTAEVADPGTQDTLTYTWSVSGGTRVGPANGSSFTFIPSGTAATITLTVTDDDTGSTTSVTQVVFGTAAADTITLTDTQYKVNAGASTNYAAGTSRIIVYGLGGNDTISASAMTAAAGKPVELIGGHGADVLTGGPKDDVLVGNNPGDYGTSPATATDDGAADNLTAGDGNDVLDPGLGNDTAAGGLGNDRYIQVSGSSDLLTELNGGGIDTIDFSLSYQSTNLSGVIFSLAETDVAQPVQTTSTGTHTVEIEGSFENVTGSLYADTLEGNELNNQILGGAGNDTIFGGEILNPVTQTLGDGQDTLVGGQGGDTVVGGSGNDIIFGGETTAPPPGETIPLPSTNPDPGQNSLVGGTGNDTVVGGSGNDIIFGGETTAPPPDSPTPDNDSIAGGTGNDTITGGSGNDIIFGGDLLAPTTPPPPGAGEDDSISGGTGNDTVTGGSGNDIIFGGEATAPPPGGTTNDDDSLAGGSGNDTVSGGSGNDIIFGGETTAPPPPGTTDDDSLSGGAGNDTVSGGAGNDIIFGGEATAPPPPGSTDDDSLTGGSGNDTVSGGAGNDIIFGGEPTTAPPPGSQDDDSLSGGSGNDTISGGAGNDIIFGGDLLAPSPGDPPPPPVNDSLHGGSGNDTVVGGSGNDIIFGGEGDDALTGGADTDLFEGGSGIDRIIDSADANIILGPTTINIGALTERFYDIEQANLAGGAGSNRIDASAFGGPVVLVGGFGNDTLIGSVHGDQLLGGDGNDSLVGSDGADFFDLGTGADFASGGDGNDNYTVSPETTTAKTIQDSTGIDSIDLSGTAYATNVDLTANQVMVGGVNRVFLVGTFENVRGSSYDDKIKGNAERNILEGFGGRDVLDGADADDTVQGGFPQLVYLDFDSATGAGEKVYTVEERNLIQAKLEALYSEPFSITFTQTAPSIGRYTAVVVNAGAMGTSEVLVGGAAYELDWRNFNAGSRADINVNGFLGRIGQPAASAENYIELTTTIVAHELGHLLGLRHSDSLGPIGINPATGLPYGAFAGLTYRSQSRDEFLSGVAGAPGSTQYTFKFGPVLLEPIAASGSTPPAPFAPPTGTVLVGATAVATFTVSPAGIVQAAPIGTPANQVTGGTLDPSTGVLSLQWNVAPQSSSVKVTYQYDAFRPGYRGPLDAFETPNHVMASPAAVGSTVTNALGNVHFGERELIKLAFADAGTARLEGQIAPTVTPLPGNLLTASRQVRNLGNLAPLAVPNLLPVGTANFGKALSVRAATVVGSIDLNSATGRSENDLYAFQGQAGDFLTVEILSASLRQRFANPIDSLIRVYDSAGNLLNYHGRPAVNDDGIDNQDSLLLDVLLPATGTYYVEVDTFATSSATDLDTGGYELFLYTYTSPTVAGPAVGGGDSIVGGLGRDVLVGSAGNDRFVGTRDEDTFLGATTSDVESTTLTEPPVATVTLDNPNPTTTDTLVATAVATDADGQQVNFQFVWTVNGVQVPSNLFTVSVGLGSTTSAFSLGAAGVQPGDLVTVLVTPSDTETGQTVAASVIVNNTAPLASPQTISVTEDTTAGVFAQVSDANGDPLTLSLTQAPSHGTVSFNSASLAFFYTPHPNYNGPDSFQYTATDSAGNSSTALINVTVTPVNDAPTLTVPTSIAAIEHAVTPIAGVSVADVDGTMVAVTLTALHGTLILTGGEPVTVMNSGTPAVTVTGPITDVNAALAGLTYQGQFNYSGTDLITVTANDLGNTGGGGPQIASATIAVTLQAVNDAPVASPLILATDEDMPIIGQLPVNDPDGPYLTYTVVGTSVNGSVSLEPSTGVFTFTPTANFNGTGSFTFKVSDGVETSEATVTIAINAVNDPPTLNAINNVTINEDATQQSVALAGIGTGAANETQTLTVTAASDNPALIPNPTILYTSPGSTGTLRFTPVANAIGTANITVSVFDGMATTQRLFTVAVNPVNDAPSFTRGPDQVVISTAGPQTVPHWATNLSAGPANESGQTLSFLVSTNNNALFSVLPQISPDGTLTYTPSPTASGSATVTVQIRDYGGTTNGGIDTSPAQTFTIQVTPSNTAPVAGDGTVTTPEDTAIAIDLRLFVSNAESADDDLIFVPGAPAHGTLTPTGAPGVYTYTPAANYSGPDSFAYTVSDGVLTDGGLVSITVTPVNDTPVAGDDSFTTAEDTPLTLTQAQLLANDSDVDGPTLSITAVTGGSAVLNGDGTITFTPVANFHGTAGFDYTLSDGSQTDTAHVTINVTPANDPPTAVDDAATIAEDSGPSTIAVLANDFDVDNQPQSNAGLTITGVTQGTNGSVTLSANGVAYTPAPNFSGSDSFSYTISDGNGGTATATVTVTVTPVNDAPVAQDQAATTDEDTALIITLGASDVEDSSLSYLIVAGPTHGTLSVVTGNQVTYTPAPNYNGPDSFTFMASDGSADSNVATVSITVHAVNDAPIATDDNFTTPEDTPLTLTQSQSLVNDTDVDGPTLNVTSVTGGTAVLNGDGSITFTPAANFHGIAGFDYTVSDGTLSDIGHVTITVTPVNDAPDAVDDLATVGEDSGANAVDVLANDTIAPDAGESLAITAVTQGAHGSVTFTATSITYTPAANFFGSDSFTYTISDGNGGSDTATVHVTISPVNDAPVAVGTAAATDEDTSTTIDLRPLVTDVDSPSTALTFAIVNGPMHGTLTPTAMAGVYTYVPAANYNGPDSFAFKANDGLADSNEAAVSIVVNAVNDAPVANSTAVNVAEDSSIDVDLRPLVTDIETPANQLIIAVGGATNGAVQLLADGHTARFTPAPNYYGPAAFSYTATDSGDGSSSAIATGTINIDVTVTEVNDAPTANPDSATVAEDSFVDLEVRSNDTVGPNEAGQTLSVTAFTQGQNGIVSLNADGTLRYTPAANFHGSDSFTYTVTDNGTTNGDADAKSATATVNITVTPVNDAPVAQDQSVTTTEDEAKSIVLGASDVDGDSLTYTVVDGPAHGTLSGTGASLTYTPAANFNGSDSFTFRVSDGVADSNLATVSITVAAVNDSPGAVDDAFATDEDVALTLTPAQLTGNDTDIDGPGLTVTAVANAVNGVVVLNADGSITFTPSTNFHGTAGFDYTVSDGSLSDTGHVTVTVRPVNDAPVAGNDNYTTSEDTPLDVPAPGVLGNDTDVDGGTLSSLLVTGPQHGTLTLNADGSFTYTPAANYHGPDSFTYRARDGSAESNLATVSITVSAVNDGPVAVNDNAATTVNIPVTMSVLANDTDVDGDALTVTEVGAPAHGTATANADGTITYTPAAGFTGADSFTYTISDGHGGTATATVNITVTGAGAFLETDPVDPTKTALVVRGTEGDDDIVLSPGSGDAVSVTLNDIPLGTFNPTGRILAYGLGGDDDIQVAGSINRAAWLFGGLGHDRLKGGAAHDVLVGGAGDDLLIGGNGRDLLIGGFGADRIVGNADEDILIAGYTDHDDNFFALGAIMDEWTRGDGLEFADRVEHLRNGGTGSLNGNFLLNDQTVHDDGAADVMTGSSGIDWFLFNANNDRVTDLSTFESENADDMDFINGS